MESSERILLPASAQRFVKLDECELFTENSVAQADLGIEISTLSIEHIEVTDVAVDVLQMSQFVITECRLFQLLPRHEYFFAFIEGYNRIANVFKRY